MNWKEKFLNKVVCGNCLDLFPEIPDNSIDVIITSPPYNCGIDYKEYNDHMKWEDYLSWCKEWLTECLRVLKSDGRICINVPIDMGLKHNNEYKHLSVHELRVNPSAELYHIFNQVGIKYGGTAFWGDNHRSTLTAWGSWKSASCPYVYLPYEIVMFGYKDSWSKKEKGISTIEKNEFIMGTGGVWNIQPETKQNTIANFPVGLPELCIKLFSYKDDIIMDPFMGSWTTAVAAKRLHRNFVGFELCSEYCKIGQDRIDNTEPLFDVILEEDTGSKDEFVQPTFNLDD